MPFHLDEDGSQVVAHICRQQYRLDVGSSHELGMEGMTDSDLLQWCGTHERCVITRNGKDFIALTHLFGHEARPHSGVLVIPRSIANDEFARIARALA